MSTFACPVVEVKLEKHPNADSLSIAIIKGWNCVVKTSDFTNDTLGVYLPIDAVASKDHPLLSFLEGKKVKTKKLRSALSQGVLLPLSAVQKHFPEVKSEVGFDASEILKVKKWEEPEKPVKLRSSPQYPHSTVSRPDWLSKYIDIENWNNFPDVIKPGEQVVITEKLHGTSVIFALIDGEYYVSSRNRCLRHEAIVEYGHYPIINKVIKAIGLNKFDRLNDKLKRIIGKKNIIPPEKTVYHDVFNNFGIKEYLLKLRDAFKTNKVAIYGEIVGVQDLMYGLKKGEIDFYAYDIRREDVDKPNQDYLSPNQFFFYCERFGIKHVPILYSGEFKPELLDLRLGNTTIPNANHMREGIVIDPVTTRTDLELGLVILKRVSEDYLMRKGGTDY